MISAEGFPTQLGPLLENPLEFTVCRFETYFIRSFYRKCFQNFGLNVWTWHRVLVPFFCCCLVAFDFACMFVYKNVFLLFKRVLNFLC